jgi:hypothetical protein
MKYTDVVWGQVSGFAFTMQPARDMTGTLVCSGYDEWLLIYDDWII